MNGPAGTKSEKSRPDSISVKEGEQRRPGLGPAMSPVIALQEVAGNRAVGAAIQRATSRLGSAPGSLIQRQADSASGFCPVCGKRGSGECPGCGSEFLPLQRSALNGNGASEGALSAVCNVLQAAGQPLGTAVRSFMESRFGQDFGRVRVHTDSQAAESARAVDAAAYTVGTDIVFGEGRYSPETRGGQQLLAHELTHVVQQGNQPFSAAPVEMSQTHDVAEQEATRLAASTFSDHAVSVSANVGMGALQRTPDDEIDRAFSEHTPSRAQPTRTPLQEPLSPEEMHRSLTSRTAFREGVKEDRILRHGNATRAMIQVIDRDGNRVALEFGRNDGRVHAEEDAIRKVRSQVVGMKSRLEGGRMVVVVNQHVCRDRCVPALRKFGEEFKLQRVDSHVFVRQAVRGSRRVSPRTTFTTQTTPSVEGRELQRVDEPIYRRSTGGPGGGQTPPGTSRTPSGGGPPAKSTTPTQPGSPTVSPQESPARRPPQVGAQQQAPRQPSQKVASARAAAASIDRESRLLRTARYLGGITQVLSAAGAFSDLFQFQSMAAGGLSGEGFIFKEQIKTSRQIEVQSATLASEYKTYSESLDGMWVDLFKSSGDPQAAAHAALAVWSLYSELRDVEQDTGSRLERLEKAHREVRAKRQYANSILESPKASTAIAVATFGTGELARIFAASQDLQRIEGSLSVAVNNFRSTHRLLKTDVEYLRNWYDGLVQVCEKGGACKVVRVFGAEIVITPGGSPPE